MEESRGGKGRAPLSMPRVDGEVPPGVLEKPRNSRSRGSACGLLNSVFDRIQFLAYSNQFSSIGLLCSIFNGMKIAACPIPFSTPRLNFWPELNSISFHWLAQLDFQLHFLASSTAS